MALNANVNLGGLCLVFPGNNNESDLQKPVKHRLAWRSSWFSDNLAPRKIIEEIKILGVLANEHTGFFS